MDLYLVGLCLTASLGLNAFFLMSRKTQSKEPQSQDAKRLLMDLLRGDALVRITRIAPEDVLLRSPRGEL